METDNLLLKKIEALTIAQKAVLTLEELSIYTGYSKSTLYKKTHKREIPFSCPNGKKLFFDRVLIDRWLLKNNMPTAEQIKKAAINYVTLNPDKLEVRYEN
ncbi:helix-turn-helix transcriptional regulator [Mucilaginibacter gilvus]|uniref:DNA-binding protein n=1 Tax=Mucilaginibacter gilvus TaxID=2305909 RepID=A0A444MMB4_9SPHI|nr:helix-turn-helix domain-containing protein [Mucilaginibacter gilvus]RWY50393.1 DNA-binding protein [Mucilaginibacter gilvus]